MSDLITLVGTIVDHEGATPLAGARITATPSQRVTQTSDGEEALSDASATTDETGAFSLALVYAEGLRYTVTYRAGGERIRRGVLDCDSYAAGATVDVADLPPIAGVPPSAVETLQAWFLAQLEALGEGGAVVSVNGQGGIVVLDAADVGAAADDDPRLSDARTPTAHEHTAADIDAGASADGQVLTSDGAGGAAWETPTSGVTDHGLLSGLGDDDHPQYALADGSRGSFAAPLGSDDNYVTDAEKAALHGHANLTALDNVSGVNTGDQVLPTWSTISGKPAVVAAGATQADARTAIGAGTSSFSGVYADLTSKPTLGDAAAKNTGTTAGTVAAGDHLHDARYVTVVEHGAVAGTARPAGATVVLWIGSVEPTNAVAGDQWDDGAGSPTVYIEEPASEGTNGQVLTTDGAGGRSWTTVAGGGGSDPWTYLVATSDTDSGTAGANVDIAGLSVSDLPDGLYEFKAIVIGVSGSAGAGIQAGIVTPSGCTATVFAVGPNGLPATGSLLGFSPAALTASSFTTGFLNASAVGANYVAAQFTGTVRASSMSGALKLTIKSEISGGGSNAYAKADSFMAYRRIAD